MLGLGGDEVELAVAFVECAQVVAHLVSAVRRLVQRAQLLRFALREVRALAQRLGERLLEEDRPGLVGFVLDRLADGVGLGPPFGQWRAEISPATTEEDEREKRE